MRSVLDNFNLQQLVIAGDLLALVGLCNPGLYFQLHWKKVVLLNIKKIVQNVISSLENKLVGANSIPILRKKNLYMTICFGFLLFHFTHFVITILFSSFLDCVGLNIFVKNLALTSMFAHRWHGLNFFPSLLDPLEQHFNNSGSN